jgi:hypothetical protein
MTYEENHERLTKAFNLVANKEDWRAAVNTFLADETLKTAGFDLAAVREAVVYFTGTMPTFKRAGFAPHGYAVTATGYRAGPAGDH